MDRIAGSKSKGHGIHLVQNPSLVMEFDMKMKIFISARMGFGWMDTTKTSSLAPIFIIKFTVRVRDQK